MDSHSHLVWIHCKSKNCSCSSTYIFKVIEVHNITVTYLKEGGPGIKGRNGAFHKFDTKDLGHLQY